MERKLIFLDVDGTLTLPGANEVPESAQRAVRRAREKGNLVFLCTGRSYGMVKPLLNYGFDGVICSSGGHIRCRDQVIYDHPIPEDQKQLAMEILRKNGVYRTIECQDCSYTDESFKEFLRAHMEDRGNSELLRWREQLEASLHILPMSEYQGQPAYKLTIISETEGQLAEPRRILEKDFVVCIQDANEYGYINGEIISRAFDKGQGVRRVCEYFGAPLEATIGFGDSMNDWEMMEVVHLGICMENGSEQLKKLADDICPGVEQDGISQAFARYELV